MVVVVCLKKDEGMGHPFVSDLASESDDEFDAGDDSDEVCLLLLGTCPCIYGDSMMGNLFRVYSRNRFLFLFSILFLSGFSCLHPLVGG